MRDRGFVILMVLYCIAVLVDFLSTLINWDLYRHLEANPLFKYGGLPLILFINILIIMAFCYVYETKGVDARFYVMFIATLVLLIRIVVIASNIGVYLDPPTIEQAMAITDQQKTQHMIQLVSLNILPFIGGAVSYFFFRMDHNIKRKWL